jgi:hypothetical protein
MLEPVHVTNGTPTTLYVQSEVPTPWACPPVVVRIEPGCSAVVWAIRATTEAED